MWAGWLRPLACFVSSISGQSVFSWANNSEELENITNNNNRVATTHSHALEVSLHLYCSQPSILFKFILTLQRLLFKKSLPFKRLLIIPFISNFLNTFFP